ncbi:MAG TPA: hypothetical protein VIJ09_03045 [Acidimicrobiales bacterium]
MGPTIGMSVALPRAGALTDALMAPPTETVGADELRRLRDRLAGDLVTLVEELPAGEKLKLDEFRFGQAREHPDRLGADDGPFVASPAVCRRAVGSAAVARCLRRRSSSPAVAVAEVLAAGAEDAGDGGDPTVRAPWWAGWYGGLSAGGRAMVEAEAVTWATQLWTALEWERLVQPMVGGSDDWWDCPGTRSLTLKGRADVRVRTEGRPVLLVVGSGVPPFDWRAALGFPALVATLARGEKSVPARVVGLWPASGQVRILPVDIEALAETATAVMAAVATWVDARLEVKQRGRPSRPGARAEARR